MGLKETALRLLSGAPPLRRPWEVALFAEPLRRPRKQPRSLRGEDQLAQKRPPLALSRPSIQ